MKLWWVISLCAVLGNGLLVRRKESFQDLERIDKEFAKLLEHQPPRDDQLPGPLSDADFDKLLEDAEMDYLRQPPFGDMGDKRAINYKNERKEKQFPPPNWRQGPFGEKRAINYKHQWKEQEFPVPPGWKQGTFGEKRAINYKNQWKEQEFSVPPGWKQGTFEGNILDDLFGNDLRR